MAVVPALAISSTPSGKGKKASEAATVPCNGSSAFMRADSGGIDPTHLAGADADRLPVASVDDGIRLHVLANLPGKQQGARFFRRGRALGDNLEICVLQG